MKVIASFYDIEDIVDDVIKYFDGRGKSLENYIKANNFNDMDSMRFINKMEVELDMVIMCVGFPVEGRDVTFYSTLYQKVIERRRDQRLKELGL